MKMRIGMCSLSRLAIVLLLAAVGGCYQASKGSPDQKPGASRGGLAHARERPEATVSVAVVKPRRMTLQWTTQGPGYIQAYEQTPIFAKIAGYVRKWHVDIGDHVAEGKI